jgi:chemotaxis protein MotA
MPLKAISQHKLTGRTFVLVIIAAFLVVLGLSMLEPLVFLNLPGLLVIILGTVGASVLSHSLTDCVEAFKQYFRVDKNEHPNVANEANIILHFAQLWFRNQYIQIDRDLSKLDKPFLKKGLQMIRDRQSNDDILALLNWQISQVNLNEGKHIGVFRSMAAYAPAFGLMGTIIALINMVYMIEQGAAVSAAASLMGFALVSTFYGLLLANFVFKPMIARLENRRLKEVRYITLLAEGIILIHQKSTPAVIRETLMTYIESMDVEQDNQVKNKKPNKRSDKKPMLVKFGLQRSSS